MGFWDIFKANPARPDCRNCRTDGISGSLLGQYREIQPVGAWKFGHLYECSRCGRFWFLDEHRRWLHRIHDNLLPLARHWNQTPLTLNALLLEELATIGGVSDYYKDYIAIPCSVENHSGQRFEKAVVLVSKQPPYFWYEPQMVHWADDIKAVSPSPFALPLDVRRASAEKREVSMGFAPTGVVDSQEKEYTLIWQSRFFDVDGVKGEEIRLSGREKNWKKRVLPSPAEAFCFVDWFEGCEELLMPQQAP